MNLLIVHCAFPDAEVATECATRLVQQRLAACANLLPFCQSIYRWNGAVQTATETVVLFKTTSARYRDLETAIRLTHPYEVPEIVAIRADEASAAYARCFMLFSSIPRFPTTPVP
jgi:periplasmic divalent cation tolerance protein